MIISSSQIKNLLQAYAKQDAEYSKRKAEEKPKKPLIDDAAFVSESARAFEMAKKAIQEIPEIREEKLKGIQAQVSTGTYEVSDEDVAEKMLARSLVDKLV